MQIQGAGINNSKGHSEECRKRIMEAMKGDEQGRKDIENEENRLNKRVAAEGEELLRRQEIENKQVKPLITRLRQTRESERRWKDALPF